MGEWQESDEEMRVYLDVQRTLVHAFLNIDCNEVQVDTGSWLDRRQRLKSSGLMRSFPTCF